MAAQSQLLARLGGRILPDLVRLVYFLKKKKLIPNRILPPFPIFSKLLNQVARIFHRGRLSSSPAHRLPSPARRSPSQLAAIHRQNLHIFENLVNKFSNAFPFTHFPFKVHSILCFPSRLIFFSLHFDFSLKIQFPDLAYLISRPSDEF